MRHKGLGPQTPSGFSQWISYYRPETAVFYRLRDEAGALHPPAGERPYRCLPSLDAPYVPAGRYQLVYFDRDRAEVPLSDGSTREILIDDQIGILRTPGELEEEEDTRHQRMERREARNRREIALTQSVEQTSLVVQRLSQTVAETNERHSQTLSGLMDQYNGQVIERETSILNMIKGVLEVMKEHTRGASEAGEHQVKLIEHLVDKARSSHDWAGVVREVVVQLGTVAQTFAPPRESSIRDGRPRMPAPPDPPQKLPGAAPRELPARTERPANPGNVTAATAPQPGKTSEPAAPDSYVLKTASESGALASGVTEEDASASWIDRFFGWSDPPPTESAPVAEVAAGESEAAPPAESVSKSAPAAQRTATEDEAEPVAVDLDELLAQLAALSGSASLPPEPPRPAEWSRSWAIEEAKRRVLALGEVGFVWTVTQPRRLLAFLKELLGAVRPPDALPALPGLRPAEVLP